MRNPLLLALILGLLGMATTTTVPAGEQAEAQPPEVSLDGLELVDKDRRGEIYAAPGVDWAVYSKILLDPATVAFRRNWQRDQNRYQPFKVRSEDMERIKAEMAELFGEVFIKELTEEGGYAMSDAAGDDVLQITPRIVDLDVYAPDTRSNPGITKSYTESAGRMTLKLELYDSVTSDLVATASDRQEAPRRGYMQWTTSVTNRAEARRMFERWARQLRERLDEARQPVASGP